MKSIAVRSGSSARAFVVRPVISNGLYGHLNNHLAHPPSLNSLRLFSEPSHYLDASYALTTRRQLLFSWPFHFFTVTTGPNSVVTIICLRPTCLHEMFTQLAKDSRRFSNQRVSFLLFFFLFSFFGFFCFRTLNRPKGEKKKRRGLGWMA